MRAARGWTCSKFAASLLANRSVILWDEREIHGRYSRTITDLFFDRRPVDVRTGNYRAKYIHCAVDTGAYRSSRQVSQSASAVFDWRFLLLIPGNSDTAL